MKEIKLTKGKFAQVDDEDFEYLNQFKWYAYKSKKHTSFYAARNSYKEGKNKCVFIHREIMQTPHGVKTDHRDRNGLNNQRYNLRKCTNAENMSNSCSRKKSSSKYKGVCWRKRQNSWEANINKEGVLYYIGAFKNEIDAALAYNIKAIELHGEFALLNCVLIPSIPFTQYLHHFQ